MFILDNNRVNHFCILQHARYDRFEVCVTQISHINLSLFRWCLYIRQFSSWNIHKSRLQVHDSYLYLFIASHKNSHGWPFIGDCNRLLYHHILLLNIAHGRLVLSTIVGCGSAIINLFQRIEDNLFLSHLYHFPFSLWFTIKTCIWMMFHSQI